MTASLKAGSPARWAAYISLVVGAGMVLLGAYMILGATHQPVPLAIALIILGCVEVVTAFYALRVVRVAWAYALAVNGVLSVVNLFGAPKVRDTAEVFIGAALTPAFIFAVITLLYALSSDDY